MASDALKLVSAKCDLCDVDDGVPMAVGEDFEYRTSPDSFLMMRCRRCESLYMNPRPAESEFPRIYPDNYHAFNFSQDDFGVIHHIRRRLEAQRLLRWCRGLGDEAKILDVGCGDGFHLLLLREFGRKSWQLHGVDVDRRAVDRARGAGLSVYEGTIESMPRHDPVDLALMIMTIEHLSSPLTTLRAVADHLRPGGRLVIVTDNVGSPDFKWFGGRHWGGYHFPRHLHLYDARTLALTIKAAGLQVAGIKTAVSPVNWVYSLRNWIVDWGGPTWLANRFSLHRDRKSVV